MRAMQVNRTYAIRVGSSKASDHRHLASVTRSSRRETFNVSVDNARRLHVGQTVALTCQSPVLAAAHVYPLTISPSWTRLVTQGMRVYELHTIADRKASSRANDRVVDMFGSGRNDWHCVVPGAVARRRQR